MNKNHQSNAGNKEWWIERLDYYGEGAEDRQLVFKISQKYKMKPKISQVYMCQYSPAVLPEFGKKRPVVIVSKRYALDADVVTVVPITSSPQEKKEQKYWVKIKAPFDKEGYAWVLCNHITAVSKERLSLHQIDINKSRTKPNRNQFITNIPDPEFQEIVKKVLNNLPDRRDRN